MYENIGLNLNLSLVTFLASFLIWIMVVAIVFLWIKLRRLKTRQMMHALFAAVIAWAASELVKNLIGAIRPFRINGFPPLTITIPHGASFPSGHAAFSFGLSAAIFLHHRKLGAVCFLASALVGAGRVMGNVHYPIDIFGGAVLGIFIALVTERLFLTPPAFKG